jgi:hypothetical protein
LTACPPPLFCQGGQSEKEIIYADYNHVQAY